MFKNIRNFFKSHAAREDYIRSLKIAIGGHVDHIKILMVDVETYRNLWHEAARAVDKDVQNEILNQKNATTAPIKGWAPLADGKSVTAYSTTAKQSKSIFMSGRID